MTVPEAAEALGLHRTRIWQYIKRGMLPARKVGRDWAVKRDGVLYLKEHPLPKGRPRRRDVSTAADPTTSTTGTTL